MSTTPLTTYEYLKEHATSASRTRGIDYWKRKTVKNIVETSDEIHATVTGMGLYKTRVHAGKILLCTCPYEGEGLCKHIVALGLTYLESHDLIPTTKIITKKDIYFSRNNKVSLETNIQTPLSLYKNICKDTKTQLQYEKKGRGYIGWGSYLDFTETFNVASRYIDQGKPYLATIVMRGLWYTLGGYFEHIDDSSGHYQCIMGDAVDQYILSLGLSIDLHDTQLDEETEINAIFAAEETLGDVYDILIDKIHEIPFSFASKNSIISRIIKKIEETYDDNNIDSYENYDCLERKKRLLECLASIQDWKRFDMFAEEFIGEDVDMLYVAVSVRSARKEFILAQESLQTREKKLEKNRNRIYYERYLDISMIYAKSIHDTSMITDIGIKQFVHNDRKNSIFIELSELLSHENLVQAILKAYELTIHQQGEDSRYNRVEGFIDLFIQIDDLNHARTVLSTMQYFYIYKKHHKVFAHLYPEEYRNMYEGHVLDTLTNTQPRSVYTEMTIVLQKMKQLPGYAEKTQKLIDHLRQTYANRRALLEELARV